VLAFLNIKLCPRRLFRYIIKMASSVLMPFRLSDTAHTSGEDSRLVALEDLQLMAALVFLYRHHFLFNTQYHV